ncbi:MAG: hypothetical protein WCP03_01195 [Candidatus Saccharibacteria bacterium]
MTKQKELDYTPHFHEAATNIANENGLFLSILNVPSNPEHFEENVAESGRHTYFDIENFRHEHQSEIEKFNDEYDEQVVLGEDKGEQLGVRIVNRGEKPTIVVFSTWSTDSKWENTKGIIEAMALTMPEYQIVYVDTPGMGKSTKATSERMKIMQQTGSFEPLADQIVPLLNELGADVTLTCGISEGTREAISVGGQLGSDVIALDSPGTNERTFTEMIKGFSMVEGKRQKEVKKHSPDKKMVEAHTKRDQARFYYSDIPLWLVRKNRLLARVQAMQKEGLKTDIERATSKGSRILDYRFEASAVADSDVALEISRGNENYDALVLPNAPHSIVETNPYAIAALIKNGIELRKTDSI